MEEEVSSRLMQLFHLDFEKGRISYRRLNGGDRKILYFHGFPGSSSQIHLFQSSYRKLGLDVICFDRPGYNDSRLQLDLAKLSPHEILNLNIEMTQQLLNSLGWSHFEIVTVSGGTPYGLSIANYFNSHSFDKKINEVRVVCGLGDLNHPLVRPLFGLKTKISLSTLPFVPGSVLQTLIRPRAQSKSARRNKLFEIFYPTSEADRKVVIEQNLSNYLSNNLSEALKQKALGPKLDAKFFVSNWSIHIHNLPPIHFWHGDEDRVIPFQVTQVMAQSVFKSQYTLIPHEGHLSLPIIRMPEILTQRF